MLLRVLRDPSEVHIQLKNSVFAPSCTCRVVATHPDLHEGVVLEQPVTPAVMAIPHVSINPRACTVGTSCEAAKRTP